VELRATMFCVPWTGIEAVARRMRARRGKHTSATGTGPVRTDPALASKQGDPATKQQMHFESNHAVVVLAPILARV